MRYFKFRESCMRQASRLRFTSPVERDNWISKCMDIHLSKMENRLLATDVPQASVPMMGRLCRSNYKRGFRSFNCVGKYDADGKCMPCDGNILPKGSFNQRAFRKPRIMFNRSNKAWHYPSQVVGSNYAGIRGRNRGGRGRISQWNLGMGRAKLTSRAFNNNRTQYDWGHFA